MGQQGPWLGPYVENNKLMITFFPSVVANLFELIPCHMTALSVYMCLDCQAFYNFE